MRKTLSAAVLVLALCAPALAGDIPNPSAPQPPPRSMTAEGLAADGEMPNGAADSLTETVLAVIKSVLALF
ncbi:MAG: hypothetical protein M3416_17915 [Acidobacteriota bacterium]|nr:hypothetical protein [Acidobacteriota bacterium]